MEKQTPRLDRELNYRKNDGIEVALMWDPDTDQTYVTVDDAKTGNNFKITVPTPDLANHVFTHPFIYQESGRIAAGNALGRS